MAGEKRRYQDKNIRARDRNLKALWETKLLSKKMGEKHFLVKMLKKILLPLRQNSLAKMETKRQVDENTGRGHINT